MSCGARSASSAATRTFHRRPTSHPWPRGQTEIQFDDSLGLHDDLLSEVGRTGYFVWFVVLCVSTSVISRVWAASIKIERNMRAHQIIIYYKKITRHDARPRATWRQHQAGVR